jgi:DNA-binding NarL/FixJ family response regulator
MLTMHADRLLVRQALRGGAKGYLLKSSTMEELCLAIRAAHEGNTYLSPLISTAVLKEFQPRNPTTEMTVEYLSPREREVLELIGEGYSNGEIAGLLNVRVKTIEKHRAGVMTKLGVHDVVGLVRIALKYGLISLD